MKSSKLLVCSTLLLALSTCMLTSCENTRHMDPEPDKEGIAVETIEGTAAFDLSARSDWSLVVGKPSGGGIKGYSYEYSVDGSKITASSSAGTEFRFAYGQKISYGEPAIMLIARNYGIKTRNVGQRTPNLENQSTVEKFTICDPLIGRYEGEVTPNLKNIQFNHVNALLTFSIDNLPANAEVCIKMFNQYIAPLQENNGGTSSYKAIVLPNTPLNSSNLVLLIKAGEKVYEKNIPNTENKQTRSDVYVPPTSDNSTLDNSTVLSFTAYIDTEDQLQIDNVEKKSRTKVWPILQ